MRTILVALFVAGVAIAQTPPTLGIRGTVTEPGSGGIAGVTVSAIAIDEPTPRTTLTDARGEFRLTVEHPGLFFIGVGKEGYFAAANSTTNPQLNTVTLSAANPQAVINVQLERGGDVGGRILDPETRNPVAGVEVFLFTRSWSYGKVVISRVLSGPPDSVKPVISDRDGRFLFTKQRPGQYLVSARSPIPAAQRILPNFSKADIETVDDIYAEAYFPGDAPAESAVPVPLASGGYADVGTLFPRKVKQYRVLASLDACGSGELVKLSILKANGSTTNVDTFPCGSQVLLKNFDPGSYALYAVSRQQGNRTDMDAAVWGSAQVEIGDKNASVSIPLQHGVIFEGEMKWAEGARAVATNAVVSTRPRDNIAGARPDRETFIRWTGEKFVLATSLRPQDLSVQIVLIAGTSAYVKEVRFNGAPLRDSILLPTSASGKLEIILDDKRSGISGTVTDGSSPVANASIMIIRESSVRANAVTPNSQTETVSYTSLGNAAGGFSIASLPPEDYRIFAVAPAQREKIHEPGVLDRILSSAQKITLGPGSSQVITVRISDAR